MSNFYQERVPEHLLVLLNSTLAKRKSDDDLGRQIAVERTAIKNAEVDRKSCCVHKGIRNSEGKRKDKRDLQSQILLSQTLPYNILDIHRL